MEGEGEGEAYRPYIVPDEIGTRFPRERTDPLVLQGVSAPRCIAVRAKESKAQWYHQYNSRRNRPRQVPAHK